MVPLRLHLQYVHGPMLPFQYAVFKDGLHLQYKRFFPVQFLLDSLAAGDKVRLDAWLGILHNVPSHKIMLAKSTSINGYIYIYSCTMLDNKKGQEMVRNGKKR